MRDENIFDYISMKDVITQYHTRVDKEAGRIPCPFHNGKHNNLSYNKEVFNCFVCGESGNVITFVAKLYGLNNNEAVKKIQADFRLSHSNGSKVAKPHKRKQTRPDQIEDWWLCSLDLLAEYCRRYYNNEQFKNIIPKVEELHQQLLDLGAIDSYYRIKEDVDSYSNFVRWLRGGLDERYKPVIG